jgi:triacylglycerol lipase
MGIVAALKRFAPPAGFFAALRMTNRFEDTPGSRMETTLHFACRSWMHRRWWLVIFFGGALPLGKAAPSVLPPAAETVVLLHGVGLRSWAMGRVESSLAKEGYRVINLTYPSRTMTLEKLGGEWLPAQLREHRTAGAARLHFVTHSMGGIVVRMWLRERGTPPNLGRVVMLAPPNAGSEVSDRLKNFPPFRWLTGINGPRLGTGAEALPATLGPWPAGAGALGIVAGDRSLNPLFSAWLAGPDDGKVAVARARLAGATEFLVLHHSHTWLQWRGDTLAHIKTFLASAHFAPSEKVSSNR